MPRSRGNGGVIGKIITPGTSAVVSTQESTQYILSGQWPNSYYAPAGSSSGPTISSIIVTDSNFNNLVDSAAATSNSFIRILGTNFQNTTNVFIGGQLVPQSNVTFYTSNELRVTLPTANTGNYTLSIFNTNNSGVLYSNNFIISTKPQWLTSSSLANTAPNTAFSFSLSATSDSSIVYSNTTSLPAGTTLLSNGYFYGSVSSLQTYTFSVKATDAENQSTIQTFNFTALVNYTVLLMTGNTGVVDQAGKNSFSFIGSPSQSTSTVKYGAGSVYFNGSSAIYLPDSSGNENFGTGNFTIEFWVYPTAGPNSTYNPTFYSNNGNGSWDLDTAGLRIHHQNIIVGGGTFTQINYGTTISNNTWTHVAVVRNGNTITVYLNGTSVGSATYSGSVGSVNTRPIIGCSDGYPSGREFMTGYIDDFRISKGTALYTTNFTPPGQLSS